MSDIAVGKPEAHATGLAATLGHVRYVLGENPVTGFAFGLFVLIVAGCAVRPLPRALRSAGQQHRAGPEAARPPRTGSAPTSSVATS